MSKLRILAVCTSNRARSILCEAMLNARPQFQASSAGSQGADDGAPHPEALDVLREKGIATEGLVTQSWHAFGVDHGEVDAFDVVLTLCDKAAGDDAPIFAGEPVRAHWSLPDPAEMDGTARDRLQETAERLEGRIDRLAALNLQTLSGDALRDAINEIGMTTSP